MKINKFYSGLSRDEWQRLKLHFRRNSSIRISARDRAIFRSSREYIANWLSVDQKEIAALPVSTTEWSSSVFKIGENKIALMDVEQANAINFLTARTFFSEKPIFTYIEFMVRAAEASLNLGNFGISIALSELCNKKLSDYARICDTAPVIARPGSIHMHLQSLIESNVSLAFVIGHEIGHLRQDTALTTMDWAKNLYQVNEYEPARHMRGTKVVRFLKPECIQKIDENGKNCGDALLQIKFMKKFHIRQRNLINEAHADCVGLVCATNAAINANIPPLDLFSFLFIGLEASEMLMCLKRLLPRLPTRGERSSVAHEHSSLGFRRYALISAIRDLRSGKITAPDGVREYWKAIPRKKIASFLKLRNSRAAESTSNRTVHISRAALHYALNGNIPNAPSKLDILEAWGPLAGDGFFLNSFTNIPRAWMEIDLHHAWEPNERDEALAVGFAAALKDISKIIFDAGTREADRDEYWRKFSNAGTILLPYVRHPRVQVFERRLSPPPFV